MFRDETIESPEKSSRRGTRSVSRARSVVSEVSDSDATPVKRKPKRPEPVQEEEEEEEEEEDESDVEGMLDTL